QPPRVAARRDRRGDAVPGERPVEEDVDGRDDPVLVDRLRDLVLRAEAGERDPRVRLAEVVRELRERRRIDDVRLPRQVVLVGDDVTDHEAASGAGAGSGAAGWLPTCSETVSVNDASPVADVSACVIAATAASTTAC